MSYKVDTSNIHGFGIISESSYPDGTVIGVWASTKRDNLRRILYQKENMNKKWYEIGDIGRYCNHQINSNTTVLLDGNDLILSSTGIGIDEEITVDYRKITEYTGFQVNIDGFIEL